jgi:hypothetical protein
MLENATKPLRKLASCALCCLAAATALAAPPAGTRQGGLLGSNGLLGKASGLLAASPARRAEFQRLDLRPPETLSGARAPVGDTEAAFPSPRHSQLDAAAGADESEIGGAKMATLRMESKVQELERRVPREGLPVARLWETKTALLHVGLSPRGKPGLWLIQKVP